VRVSSRTSNSRVALRQPNQLRLSFADSEDGEAETEICRAGSPRGLRRFEPYGSSGLNSLNRRMRIRMYGGVAGESGRPLPLCRFWEMLHGSRGNCCFVPWWLHAAACAILTLRVGSSLLLALIVGAWLSLARAPGSGPGGRWFKSTRPDHSYLPLSY
jgi:hypothetical protein